VETLTIPAIHNKCCSEAASIPKCSAIRICSNQSNRLKIRRKRLWDQPACPQIRPRLEVCQERPRMSSLSRSSSGRSPTIARVPTISKRRRSPAYVKQKRGDCRKCKARVGKAEVQRWLLVPQASSSSTPQGSHISIISCLQQMAE
jgi:hypothetical protein